MLLGALLGAVVCGALAAALRRPLGGALAGTLAALLWSLVVVGLVTLIPADGAPGIVSAEGRLTTCSWDIGGPAPEGFWIFGSGQRLLNTVLFVPSGVLITLLGGAVGRRWPRTRPLVPAWTVLGLVLLAAASTGIEYTQLELARLDRACDVTDIVDNTTGAVIGVLLGSLVVGTATLLGRRGGRRPRARLDA
ncbi:hypothetical protein GCM10022215_30600 [Nocardioides fonticola]|uniref:VanZ-like domain-containing protein n=2 Tax=Nocardioides fonticola TaxID=450363 RepID=A0ABP7XQS9_9ACTN